MFSIVFDLYSMKNSAFYLNSTSYCLLKIVIVIVILYKLVHISQARYKSFSTKNTPIENTTIETDTTFSQNKGYCKNYKVSGELNPNETSASSPGI